MKSTQTASGPAEDITGTRAVPSADQTALIAATRQESVHPTLAVTRARAFAEPLLAGELLDTGEPILDHADAMVRILQRIGGSEVMQAASFLVYACDHLNKPQEVITKAFGDNFAALAIETAKLVRVQRQARLARLTAVVGANAQTASPESAAIQTENVRKMLLAFSRDLRVVMLRLASRLQTLRYFAASKLPVPAGIASRSHCRFSHRWPTGWGFGKSNGRWRTWPSVSWSPTPTARWRAAGRKAHRNARPAWSNAHANWNRELRPRHRATVSGSTQAHLQHRQEDAWQVARLCAVFTMCALRVLVATVPECYGALSWVHSRFTAIAEEFDDYIAKPKVNGYQSLHTVVRDSSGKATEIQIRTQSMHDHAENGVAAHWAYKEAGAKGYAGVTASGSYDAKIAVLRQLLAWERDLSGSPSQAPELLDDRIYVLTPDAAIVELPQGATAVDFAYTVHTSLGHRCRGARVDGAMVPLHTPLKNGQTVEITATKEGGPSRDWLNPELGYLVSHRARTKVRAWFNALALSETVAKGREAVEKLLQREGKTALKLDDLAVQLGFSNAESLFEDVGKDEFSLRSIEQVLRPPETPQFDANAPLLRKSRAENNPAKGGLLVVGVDSLMTQMAKCCKPAPPDAICGFVTRGKGVSVHRRDCTNLRELLARNGERLIEVDWGVGHAAHHSVYPVDVAVQAQDRQGLLRDISEVFTKEKMNVTGVQTQSIKGVAWMTFTIEVADSGRLHKVLGLVADLPGVRSARRK
jgi:GTP pyrophosphokinase